jgi:hypothetical protein
MKYTPSSGRYAKITGVEVRSEMGDSQSRRMRILGSVYIYIQPEIRIAS